MIIASTDEAAVYRQIVRLARAMDARDWAAAGAVMDPEATADLGTGELVGPDAIVALMRSFLDECGPSQHLVGNVLVDIGDGGDTAVSRAYVSDMHLGTGEQAGLTFRTLGDYHDRWIRRGDDWLLARRVKTATGTVGDPAVLGPGPAGRTSHPGRAAGEDRDAATAITNLLYRYGELIDAGRLEAAAELFDGAAVTTASGTLDGAGLLALWRQRIRIHSDGTPRTKHLITNPVLEIDRAAGRARARSYYTVLQAAEGFDLQVVAAGRYDDRFARAGGRWRFTARDYLPPDLIGRLDQHLR